MNGLLLVPPLKPPEQYENNMIIEQGIEEKSLQEMLKDLQQPAKKNIISYKRIVTGEDEDNDNEADGIDTNNNDDCDEFDLEGYKLKSAILVGMYVHKSYYRNMRR